MNVTFGRKSWNLFWAQRGRLVFVLFLREHRKNAVFTHPRELLEWDLESYAETPFKQSKSEQIMWALWRRGCGSCCLGRVQSRWVGRWMLPVVPNNWYQIVSMRVAKLPGSHILEEKEPPFSVSHGVSPLILVDCVLKVELVIISTNLSVKGNKAYLTLICVTSLLVYLHASFNLILMGTLLGRNSHLIVW